MDIDSVKVVKELTDYQLVEAAEKLALHNTKDNLPVKYSLKDLMMAEEALNLLAESFLNKHGTRLKGLAPGVFNTLKAWNPEK